MLTHKHTSIRMSNLSVCKQQMRGTPVTSARERFIYLRGHIIIRFLRPVCGEPDVFIILFCHAQLVDRLIIGTCCLYTGESEGKGS